MDYISRSSQLNATKATEFSCGEFDDIVLDFKRVLKTLFNLPFTFFFAFAWIFVDVIQHRKKTELKIKLCCVKLPQLCEGSWEVITVDIPRRTYSTVRFHKFSHDTNVWTKFFLKTPSTESKTFPLRLD